jgi:hypothetical protein
MNGQIIAFTTEALWLVLLLSGWIACRRCTGGNSASGTNAAIYAQIFCDCHDIVYHGSAGREQPLYLYRCHIHALPRNSKMINLAARSRRAG